MDMPAAKTAIKYCHPAFEGLADKALNAVYSSGRIQTLDVGTFLFRAGAAKQTACLILEGACELLVTVQGQPQPLAAFGQGDYLSPRLCLVNGDRTASIRVTGQMRVFIIDDALIAGLDPAVQCNLYRNFANLSVANSSRVLAAMTGVVDKSRAMQTGIQDFLRSRNARYRESASIRGLLQTMPRLPSYASELTSLLISNSASMRDVVNLAKMDPSMTASLLKTVNSAYFGLRHKVVDFQHAFVLLGFNQLYQIIINKGINSTMPKTAEFQQLQFHSMMISVLCFEISHAVKLGNPPLLSTIGLLHDIGKSVILLLTRLHPGMAFLLNQLDPALVGTLLLQEWEIPLAVSQVVEYLGDESLAPPDAAPPEHQVSIAVLYLAHQCFDYMTATNPAPAQARNAAFFTDHMAILKQPAGTLAEFIRTCLAPSIAARPCTQPKPIQQFLGKLRC